VTTKTKRKTKTTRKKVKLKKASKKSYTKKLPKKKKTTTKTRKSGKKTVKTQTTVQTATTEKYTKKSKQKVVTQKIVTTVKTTTTVAASQQNAQTQEVSFQSSGTQNSGSAKTSSQKASKHTISNVASIAPKMDSRVLNAYARMGFTVTVDPNAAYAGHFDARSRSITIQEADETIYHELGHFLAFIAGNVDQSSAFASVYNSEKAKFTGYNKAYATQNAAEYFAESVKDYMLNGAALSSQRPNTYKAIQSALNTVTTARADVILKAYSSIWS
ncbi:MAG: anthrax toxin lethal factor-related metalloendopeptidase, partial [Ruminococcus sp.]